MRCDCGHSADHHNPGKDNCFSGNCRNCKCTAFSVGSSSERPNTLRGLMARHRGEYIVRRWNDDVEALKADHVLELVKRDVILEDQKRLMRIANKRLVELEVRLKKHGGHTDECETNYHIKGLPCDCGWSGHDKSCPARLGSTCDCGKL